MSSSTQILFCNWLSNPVSLTPSSSFPSFKWNFLKLNCKRLVVFFIWGLGGISFRKLLLHLKWLSSWPCLSSPSWFSRRSASESFSRFTEEFEKKSASAEEDRINASNERESCVLWWIFLHTCFLLQLPLTFSWLTTTHNFLIVFRQCLSTWLSLKVPRNKTRKTYTDTRKRKGKKREREEIHLHLMKNIIGILLFHSQDMNHLNKQSSCSLLHDFSLFFSLVCLL